MTRRSHALRRCDGTRLDSHLRVAGRQNQIVFILASATGRPSGSATTTNRPHVAFWAGPKNRHSCPSCLFLPCVGILHVEAHGRRPAVVPAGKMPLSS